LAIQCSCKSRIGDHVCEMRRSNAHAHIFGIGNPRSTSFLPKIACRHLRSGTSLISRILRDFGILLPYVKGSMLKSNGHRGIVQVPNLEDLINQRYQFLTT